MPENNNQCRSCGRPNQTIDGPNDGTCRAWMTASYNGDCHYATVLRVEAAENRSISALAECEKFAADPYPAGWVAREIRAKLADK
jgi:hypothetical protein